jgi:predicted lipase
VKEISKTVQDMKVKIETEKKAQTDEILKMENLEKTTGTTDASITNRIQEMEKRISCVEDTLENTIHQSKNTKAKNLLTKHPENFGYHVKT